MRRLPLVLIFGLSGCYSTHGDLGRPLPFDGGGVPFDGGGVPFDGGGGPDATTDMRDAGPLFERSRALDVLFVVDNSSGMREEQASVARELPTLLGVLSSGDLNQDGDTDDEADFAPISDIHFGVVTTDMGTGGFSWPTCEQSDFGDDGVLARAAADCPGPPEFVTWGAPGAVDDAACLAARGDDGCGFEQPLEAALKALSPNRRQPGMPEDYTTPVFFRGARGHGDGVNAAFGRAGAALLIVLITNEDDCSAADPELFDPNSDRYASQPNLRCFANPDALHSLDRYVDGLLALRPPGRVAIHLVAGVPSDLAPSGADEPDWGRLIGPEPERDSRMLERVDPVLGDRLVPSCTVPGLGISNPPVRLVQFLESASRRGAPIGLASICQSAFLSIARPALEALRR